jgi:F-type H+-transporting ATPase subunit b
MLRGVRESSMPQFQVANFVPQLAWLTLFFAILYFGIVRLTLPRIGRVVDSREAQVKGDIARAEAAKAEADRVREAYENGMTRARDDAHALVADAQAKATRATEARLHAAGEATEAKLGQAQAELAAARDRARGEIAGIAASIAAEIVERVSGTRPSDTAAQDAVQQIA